MTLVIDAENQFCRADIIGEDADSEPRLFFYFTGLLILGILVVNVEVSRIAFLILAHIKRHHHLERSLILDNGIFRAHGVTHGGREVGNIFSGTFKGASIHLGSNIRHIAHLHKSPKSRQVGEFLLNGGLLNCERDIILTEAQKILQVTRFSFRHHLLRVVDEILE